MGIEDRLACEALVISYTHLIDMGRAGEVHELFADDGVWESAELRMEGRDGIRQGFQRRQARSDRRSRHICTNTAITIAEDRTSATGLTYFQLYRHDGTDDGVRPLDGQPVLVGEYHDEFVNGPEGWRFKHRRATPSFVRSEQ